MAGETGLVDIKKLVLSDTFNTWFDTTNQIIDALVPVSVYGIASTTGVNLISGLSSGNYSGIKTIGLKPGHGIGYYASNDEVSLNYSGLSDGYTIGAAIVATGDYYAFTDISDPAQGADGTIKRVRASDMLPPVINAPNGPNGTLTLEGNLTINGQLFVGGDNSFIASNDIRIEDKNIEIAYQQAGSVGITGTNSGNKYSFNAGVTAYYYDPGTYAVGITYAAVIGIVKSSTGPASGPTAEVKIGSVFTKGGPELFSLGGVIRFGGATGISFGVVGVAGNNSSHWTVASPTEEYFSDALLDGAGITIKGASGDKTFVWKNSQRSMVTNTPLGVAAASPDQYINSRYFRNYGLTSDNRNDFIFLGTSANSENTSISLGYDNKSYWTFEQDTKLVGATSGTRFSEPLILKHTTSPIGKQYNYAVGLTGIPYTDFGTIGVTGITASAFPLTGDNLYFFPSSVTAFSGPSGASASTFIGRVRSRTVSGTGNAVITVNYPFIKGTTATPALNGYVAFDTSSNGPTGPTFGIYSVSSVVSRESNIEKLPATGSQGYYYAPGISAGTLNSYYSVLANVREVVGASLTSSYALVKLFYPFTTYNSPGIIPGGYWAFNGTALDGTSLLGGSIGNTGITYATQDTPGLSSEYYSAAPTTYVLSTIIPATPGTEDLGGIDNPGPLDIANTAGGTFANHWAKGFNADYLDGAGADYVSTPNSIPVADGRGRIPGDWLEAQNNRQKLRQVQHGFVAGTVVALDTSGKYIRANAYSYSDPSSEAIGIVESVIGVHEFVLVTSGFISGLPKTLVPTTGDVYFVSAVPGGSGGGMTNGEPTLGNSVRKPIFYSTNENPGLTGFMSGYVLTHPGQIVGFGQTATDQVYLESVSPIGVIQQYSGSFLGTNLPSADWIPCDGRAVSYQSYIDLYNTIGNVYYARGIVNSAAGVVNPIITIERGTRGLDPNDIVTIVFDNGSATGGTSWMGSIIGLSASNGTITLTGDAVGAFPETKTWAQTGLLANAPVRIYGKVDTTLGRGVYSTFFVPDMQARYGVGGITGEFVGMQGNGTGLTAGTTGGSTGGFLATNYILRAVKTSPAAIIVGHQHDDRYLFKTKNDVHSVGGITFSGGPYVFQNTSASIPALLVGINGNVGVGTQTPTAKLQTIDTSNAARFGVNNVNSLTIGGNDSSPYAGIGYNVNFNSGNADQYFAVGADLTSLIRFHNGGFQFKGNTANGAVSGTPFALTEYMTILNSGNVGVGTTTPTARLHVKSTAENSMILETTNAVGQNYLTFNDPSGRKGYLGYGGVGNDEMRLQNSEAAPLYFATYGSDRMVILADGKVGIGTTTPIAGLEISATTASPHLLLRTPASSNTLPIIQFMEGTAKSWALVGCVVPGAGANGTFGIRDDFQSGTPVRLAITRTGNVGIGTITPTSTLEIVGSVAISGGMTGGFFAQPHFNTSAATNITASIVLGPSLFPNSPTSVFTVDPGSGISVTTGSVVTVNSGFTWKIM